MTKMEEKYKEIIVELTLEISELKNQLSVSDFMRRHNFDMYQAAETKLKEVSRELAEKELEEAGHVVGITD